MPDDSFVLIYSSTVPKMANVQRVPPATLTHDRITNLDALNRFKGRQLRVSMPRNRICCRRSFAEFIPHPPEVIH